jgi:hypothetical protein
LSTYSPKKKGLLTLKNTIWFMGTLEGNILHALIQKTFKRSYRRQTVNFTVLAGITYLTHVIIQHFSVEWWIAISLSSACSFLYDVASLFIRERNLLDKVRYEFSSFKKLQKEETRLDQFLRENNPSFKFLIIEQELSEKSSEDQVGYGLFVLALLINVKMRLF